MSKRRENWTLKIVPFERIVLLGRWWWYCSIHFCCCRIIVFSRLQQCWLSHFLCYKRGKKTRGIFPEFPIESIQIDDDVCVRMWVCKFLFGLIFTPALTFIYEMTENLIYFIIFRANTQRWRGNLIKSPFLSSFLLFFFASCFKSDE